MIPPIAAGIGRLALDLIKFNLTYDLFKMIGGIPKKGYHVPWTKSPGKIADLGRKYGAWGEGGLLSGEVSGMSTYMKYSKFGGLNLGSAMASTVSELTPQFGARVAGNMASRAAAFRFAGIAARGINILTLSSFLPEIPIMAYQKASEITSKYYGLELGGYFPETQAAVTSRQRNIQAITASNLQARSAIGNEAMLFHR